MQARTRLVPTIQSLEPPMTGTCTVDMCVGGGCICEEIGMRGVQMEQWHQCSLALPPPSLSPHAVTLAVGSVVVVVAVIPRRVGSGWIVGGCM